LKSGVNEREFINNKGTKARRWEKGNLGIGNKRAFDYENENEDEEEWRRQEGKRLGV